jgi:nitroimidazol reductase NimA-like FMN-containing flavoprotein (pyridoxamine 5'-phosphate oxidase superfamily)
MVDNPEFSDPIRVLIDGQLFAVLCTQGEGQPYGSVVAYAVSSDLKSVVFATPVDTRKYRLLCACDRVALVIDSHPALPDQIMGAEAVIATGRAVQVSPGTAFDHLVAMLTSRHPKLAAFVADPSSALFRIEVDEYAYVAHFQEVHRWRP